MLLIGYLLLVMSSGSTARPGTTVQGVDIRGMSQEEAAAAVEAALGPIAAKRLKVRALDQTFGLRPEEAGLSLDAEASVAPAFGRTWNPIDLVAGLFGLQRPAGRGGRRRAAAGCPGGPHRGLRRRAAGRSPVVDDRGG